MSDKNSESFEEWFNRRVLEISKVFQRESSEFQGKPPIMVEEAWNHQQKKIDKLEAKLDAKFKTPPIVFALEEKLQVAEGENKILRKAVEFYADEGNWITQSKDQWMQMYYGDGEKLRGVKHSLYVGGRRARQALEKVEKK